MTKKFTARRARDASLARKAAETPEESTAFVVREPETRTLERWVEREEEGLARVRKYQAMSLEDLETSRIEHESALLDIELQLEEHGDLGKWADTARCAIRHRKVNLRVIEQVTRLKTSLGRTRADLFLTAATKIFESEDIQEAWAAAKALDPNNPCWTKEG